MFCAHEACTGNHDDRKYATLCPRTKENKRQQSKDEYWRSREHRREYEMKRRGTAKNMLAKMRYEATRRGGRSRAPVE